MFINKIIIDRLYNNIHIFFIMINPLLLFLIIFLTNNIPDRKYINLDSYFIYAHPLLFLYAFLSIKLSKNKYIKNIKNQEQIVYSKNGFNYWKITTIFVCIIGYLFKNISISFTQHFFQFILIFQIFGILITIYLFLLNIKKFKNFKNEKKNKKNYSFYFLFKIYNGFVDYPKLLGVDMKQLINCRIGIISWQIIILLFFFYKYHTWGFNNSVFVNVFLQSIYICNFFYWEESYIESLDVKLDKYGYYLYWKYLVLVPGFYTYSTFYLINQNNDISIENSLIILILGLFFTFKNTEINRQKWMFNINKEKVIYNDKPCDFLTLKYEDDKYEKYYLLSGSLGSVRHSNYTYEILLSFCWGLPGYKYGIYTFIYFFYILFYLINRAYNSEEKSKKKYGIYWEEYCSTAKYQFIKYLF